MHGYNGKDLARSFRTVRQNTIQIAEEIPEDKYDFRPSEGTRSVAETLRHIACSFMWVPDVHGNRVTQLNFEMFRDGMAKQAQAEAALKTKADILGALRTNGETIATFMEKFPEEALAEHVNMPPEGGMPAKTRFEMLLSPKEHEMHHRGQLMVVERMLGIVPHLTRQMQERMAAMNQRQATGA